MIAQVLKAAHEVTVAPIRSSIDEEKAPPSEKQGSTEK